MIFATCVAGPLLAAISGRGGGTGVGAGGGAAFATCGRCGRGLCCVVLVREKKPGRSTRPTGSTRARVRSARGDTVLSETAGFSAGASAAGAGISFTEKNGVELAGGAGRVGGGA